MLFESKKTIAAIEQLSAQQSRIEQQLQEFQTLLQRHDIALDELLDEMEEKSATEQELSKSLQTRDDEQQALLLLLLEYETAFCQLQRLLTDPAWQYQLERMSALLSKKAQQADLTLIRQTGIPVDYDWHEVIAAEKTAIEEQNGTVCELLAPGLMYHGHVIRKAQVSAYRYEEGL